MTPRGGGCHLLASIRLRLRLRRDIAGDRIRTDDVQLGKPDGEHRKPITIHDVTDDPSPVVPRLVPREHENASESHDTQADRLVVIADLLAELPQAERREVIAGLPPTDRAAIARLLIGRNRKGGRA